MWFLSNSTKLWSPSFALLTSIMQLMCSSFNVPPCVQHPCVNQNTPTCCQVIHLSSFWQVPYCPDNGLHVYTGGGNDLVANIASNVWQRGKKLTLEETNTNPCHCWQGLILLQTLPRTLLLSYIWQGDNKLT